MLTIIKLSDTEFATELDIAHCITLGEFLDQLETYNLKLGNFTARGPAGGNPLCQLIGTEKHITDFVTRANSAAQLF